MPVLGPQPAGTSALPVRQSHWPQLRDRIFEAGAEHGRGAGRLHQKLLKNGSPTKDQQPGSGGGQTLLAHTHLTAVHSSEKITGLPFCKRVTGSR